MKYERPAIEPPETGYVDLHSHYVPAVDDGVRSHEEGVSLCRGLAEAGFSMVVATPHIRTAMFENRRDPLGEAHRAFCAEAEGLPGMPVLGLGAEHYFDDVFWRLFEQGEALPYPGGKSALVELPRERLPHGLAQAFFRMKVAGVHPVLAHPERYRPFFESTDAMDPLLDVGALPLLDVMALTGKYGKAPQKAAERMLDEGVYYAACSDAHRPADALVVAEAIDLLEKRVGTEEKDFLLHHGPRDILAGTIED
ncbi:MAG: protein tyrosine phosphatase [Deltaproteobacteria bacterium]|nr:protein tyrosine phosphatase [Deltaproteobacteria bacterium]